MPVRPPSLRSIAAFEAAARHASFTKAAAELNLTTGAISHAIKALEHRLDQRLFDRSGRSVELTSAGQRLAARVRLSLGLLSDAFDTAAARGRDRLVISTLASIAQKLLVPSLPMLRASVGHAVLDIRSSNALADVERDADIAIRFGPGRWRGHQTRHLGDELLFPVASPDYRQGRLPQSLQDLSGCTLIHHPESSWRLWFDPLELDLLHTADAIHIDDSLLSLEVAAAGNGVALARGRLVEADLKSGRLVRLFERAVPAEYAYWAVWSGASSKQPLIKAFVETAADLFADDEKGSSRD